MLKWGTNLSVRFVTKVDLSLIFPPSNCILGHASHYQSIPILWLNLQEQSAVFTKQLKKEVDTRKEGREGG